MRKINAVLSIAILALFLVHGIMGGFQLMGIVPGGDQTLTVISWILAVLIGLHTLVGIKLTVDTLKATKAAGVSYPGANRLFWTRRISGFAIMLFIICHILVFMGSGSGSAYRLIYFGTFRLIVQILLVVSVAIHAITNIRPLLISFGIKGYRVYVKDVLFILAIVMLFCAAAMVIYYLRWNVLWRLS